ncbi:cytidylate kinase family protein [Candidatus Micrarchaeota archaeon]|nr:cytidylate kinase family protein [Candidatus Micrarchaeota archaeon]
MKTAISGLSGCGNTTVSKRVAEALGIRVANYTFRQLSNELGIGFEELHEKSKTDPKYDLMLDKKLIELSGENSVLSSRLAIWLSNADLKVWLHASLKERARRISSRDKAPLEETLEKTKKRDKENSERYKGLYGVNIKKFVEVADLVINTESYDEEGVAELIVEAARNPPKKPNRKAKKFAKKIRQTIDSKLV